jgi:3-deoxy-D-manno-octulosonic-acid transferase
VTYFLYSVLAAAVAPFVELALRLPGLGEHRERLGRLPPDLVARIAGRRPFWVHNASVGELAAATPLVHALRERFPGHPVVISATSLAGRDLARRIPEVDGAFLLPLDLGPCVERALATLSPAAFVFTETEIWPNLLRALARRRVPALLVSGRISPRAFRRYRRIRAFLRQVFEHVALFAMQSEGEAERIRALGAPPDRVEVTGSLKLDAVASAAAFEIEPGGPLWVAGSTHAGEEEACLGAFLRLRRRFPDLRLLLAPRHLGRTAEVEALLAGSRAGFVRRSRLDGRWRGDPPILLLDTLGELAGLYRHAAVAFVGGSLASVGGHNPLEPARAAVPVIVGPHVESVAELVARLESSGAALRVADPAELERAVDGLLSDPARRERMAIAAGRAAPPSGAVEKTIEAVVRVLGA